MTKFKLSIDLFTPGVGDAIDVATALRGVADRLTGFTSLPWSPYALGGTICVEVGGNKKVVGGWNVEPERTADLKLLEEAP